MIKAIGGYFDLECGRTPLYYKDGIYLNSGRNALRYLIRGLGIKKIHVPNYTCHVVSEAIEKEGCQVEFYNIDIDLFPTNDFPPDDFIIYNNYFGVSGYKVREMSKRYTNLIVDNAQAFYSADLECRAAVYSPRKFFGLPDGGILRGSDLPQLYIELGQSVDVMSHLLIRKDYDAEKGYGDFSINDSKLDEYNVEGMSKLTKALMGNIDYEYAKKRRLSNFSYLWENLRTEFPISMTNEDVPMVYPYYSKNGEELRKKLIEKRIYTATYWPELMVKAQEGSMEYDFVKNILSIPIDQRYGENEMEYIIEVING